MKSLALLVLIANAEMDYGIPQNLLKAILTVESNLNPYALVVKDGVGGRSSYGIGQVQLRTAQQFRKGISAKELYDPVINIRISAAYLRWQFERYDSWDRAVVAYNKGNSTGSLNEYHRKVTDVYVRGKGFQESACRKSATRRRKRKRCVIAIQPTNTNTTIDKSNIYAEEYKTEVGEISGGA